MLLILSGMQTASASEYEGPHLRAQLRAINHATISAGIPGVISTFAFRPGDVVSEGDNVVSFDCTRIQAREEIAAARADAAEVQYISDSRLYELDNLSEVSLASSESQMKAAQSELKMARHLVSECSIAAPFDGRITEKHVQAHEYVREGEPVFSIVDTTNLEAEMIVPSDQINRYAQGMPVNMLVDETGAVIQISVDRIIRVIDPVSETFRVICKVMNGSDTLLPGMSGSIEMQSPES